MSAGKHVRRLSAGLDTIVFKTVMQKNSSKGPSVFTRVRNRFRYGLATQEVLDRLSATLGLVIYPYFFVHEQIQPGMEFTNPDDGDDYQVRYLTEHDMQLLESRSAQRRSAGALVEKLRSGSRCLGFFVNGEPAAYTWYRLDRVPVAMWMTELFRLEDDEAYLFDAYVLPAYRGRRLAPLVRYRAYEELKKIGRHRLYSITLGFNASSRRFKQRLQGKETELRLLVGFKRWKGIDIRLRAFDDHLRTPARRVLGRIRPKTPPSAS